MKLKQPAFILMMLWIVFVVTACAGPQKSVSAPVKKITAYPPPAMVIEDLYSFTYETARCEETPQFLITASPYSISAPEKALKMNLQMFAPKAAPEAIQTLSVFFPIDSSALDSPETKKLDQFINQLNQDVAGMIVVSGYTCRLGSAAYNQKLAMTRARTVADYLKRHGITIASVTGKAGCCFISDTEPALNRRVEITRSLPVGQTRTHNQKGGNPEIKPKLWQFQIN